MSFIVGGVNVKKIIAKKITVSVSRVELHALHSADVKIVSMKKS